MRSRYRVLEPEKAHFITATIVEWLPVFTTSACCDLLVQSLAHCRQEKGLLIHAWVIMDNHFHAVVSGPNLSKTLADLKKFTARGLLQQIRLERRDWLINQLAYFCARHKQTSTHQIWQEGSHPQSIFSDEMMLQKIEYIHNNPVRRGLVGAPEHWRYSSAHEWLNGTQVLKCDEWR